MRRPTPPVILALSTLFVLFGCGGAVAGQAARTHTAVAPPPTAAGEETTGAAVAGRGTIARAELAAVLDGGLGRFLGRVETEPARENGQFVGFRVVSLEGALAADDATGSGVRAGDVVVRVNGQIIERPEQALVVWEGLRVASTLAIEYLRAGQRREARFEIVD